MEDVEIQPKNAPRNTNMMIEALVQHNHQQREARDCQEYQRQLDSHYRVGPHFTGRCSMCQGSPRTLEFHHGV